MSDEFMDNLLGLSDGSTVTVSDSKEYESSSSSGFSLFPHETSVRAAIDEAKWYTDQKTGLTRLSLRWMVLAPEDFENRKVFQSLWIKDLEPNALAQGEDKAKAKRDRARMMFGVIDANAGGKLAELISKGTSIKDEHLMAHLTNKPMVIRIDLMVPKKGDPMNFVAKVSPKNAEISTPEQIARGKAEVADIKKSAAPASRDLGDDIPF